MPHDNSSSLRWVQHGVAAAAVALVVALALFNRWPFDDSQPAVLASVKDPSIWQFLFSDRITLGLVRLAVMALGLYVVASIPALMVGARWLRGIGPGTADPAPASLPEATRALQTQIEKLTRERDEALEVAKSLSERNTAP